MDRRTFVGGITLGFLAAPLAAEAQQAGKLPRIAYFGVNTAEDASYNVAAFRQGLRERGWIEGQNLFIEYRFAGGKVNQLPNLVAELINLNVDMIVTTSSATTRAARDATKTIPIVMSISADALGEGYVGSLAHPGGNITGMTFLVGPEIAANNWNC
jgi:putative ABC transport system substrate-binding protein